MRVTENMRASQVLRDMGRLREDYAAAADAATSGLLIGKPSDDPSVAARLQRVERSLQSGESMSRALSLGKTDLELAESSLAEAGNLLQRAKEITLLAANGASNADLRNSAAEEIDGIRSTLLGIANAKGMRGYIFAGSQTDAPAFDGGFAYQGDTYEHSIRSGPTSEVVVSASGADAFTAAGGTDIFQDLADLSSFMNSNDQAGIAAGLTSLDTAHEQVVLVRSRAGVNLARADQAESMLTSSKFLFESQKAAMGAADPAETFTELSNLQNSIQRSIGVSNQLLNMDAFSLL